jgi:uncharacterized membrane-anchored protein YhcB (DUF1043 family)
MAQETNISEFMGWFWTALGLLCAGVVGIFRWLLKSRTEIELIKDDIGELKTDIEEIKEKQTKHEDRHNEVLKKIDELHTDLTKTITSNTDNLREYFDEKYKVLDQRIYEQKK